MSRALPFDAVLILLLVGTVVGDRTFAHLDINLGRFPLYITDAALAALMLGILLSRTLIREARVVGRSALPFLPYLAWGTLLFLLALPFRGIEAARDYAVFYYAAFILVGILAIRRPEL